MYNVTVCVLVAVSGCGMCNMQVGRISHSHLVFFLPLTESKEFGNGSYESERNGGTCRLTMFVLSHTHKHAL